MINILILLAGKSRFFDEEKLMYPIPMMEIGSKMLIEKVIENLSVLDKEIKFIFVVRRSDCDTHHLDDVLKTLTNDTCQIIKIHKETAGSVCSALMAIEYIDTKSPLLIANYDQIFDCNLCLAVDKLRNSDGVIITFESTHPRWSYVMLGEEKNIIEVSEKRPISSQAIAGFYLFKHGSDYVTSAMDSIRKESKYDNKYYTSSVLNEMILAGKKLDVLQIDHNHYHTFYTPEKLSDYDKYIRRYSV